MFSCHVTNLLVSVINHRAVLLKYTLGDNESSCERSAAFPSFLFDAQEYVFETFEVIMLEPANCGARICRPFRIAKLIPRSATMMSPRFANADITQGIVENP